MIKYITSYFTLLIVLITLGCHPNNESAIMEMAEDAEYSPIPEQDADEDVVERKLIKEGHITFETQDLTNARKNIFTVVSKYKAYVSSDQEYKYPGRKSNTLVIRVPADNFDNLLKDATEGVERFESREINVNDVTEEFLDISARLKTKKELENRFLELLKKANTVTEIVEIEKQIAQLRSEIESVEGRLKYLENRVAFSTLTMTFYQSLPEQTEFGQKFENGFKNGWDNLVWFFVLMINIWPFIIILLGLFIGVRIYRKRRKK
ncbi:hypothetical protein GCM10011506_38360 [Marivirga lumbricoides]|uniref:DUF4349 domain-containing protein n=1 Tax=Marivirga lumbricoides TaxID=1046115 RepID=A0ABQ1N1D5_9BACT|nr:hypothetical protein GCM10011506_38360 [Marivirga lumbricoides]